MRQVSWANIGNDITQAQDIRDALSIAGLDYTVKSCDAMYNVDGETYPILGRKVTYKESDPSKIFGIVSNTYQICQNEDAFDFINYIDEDVKYLKAGETYNGLVYIIGELPEVSVLGDTIKPNIIFQNSHNGLGSIKSTICMLRVVCQNQFAHAFKDSVNGISIRHASTMDEKLIAARETIRQTYNYIKSYKNNANKFATTKITDRDLQNIIQTLIVKTTDRDIMMRPNNVIKINKFLNAYNADDNTNFRGSAWGIINAFTDYSTHAEKTTRATSKFEDNLFINNSLYNPDLDKLVNMMEEKIAA